MLINLKLLRSVKASLLFSKYYYTYGTQKVDEYLINIIFYNKISFLPFEYGIPDFEKNIKIGKLIQIIMQKLFIIDYLYLI